MDSQAPRSLSRRAWIALVAVGVAALGAGAWLALSHNDAELQRQAAVLMDAEMPDLTGAPLKLSRFRGKVLFVNFWATWCGPCRDEMPQFIRAQTLDGAKGVQFAGIAVDQADKVRKFATEIGLNYPTLVGGLGAMELSKSLGNSLMALPFTVVLDRHGQIVETHLGPVSQADLERLLKKLL